MKLSVIFICLFYFYISCLAQHFLQFKHGLPPVDEPQLRAKAPILQSIIQPVDHFDVRNSRTFSMRYYTNDQFYQNGGPIIVFIGAEWAIEPAWLMTGLAFDLAQIHNGILFYTEHRFYGNSHPTPNHNSNNMKYLSSDQALADLIRFIVAQKELIDGADDSKVVLIGGSYGGTLATWARYKYPHLIDAAWSSSAPLRATEQFYEYYQAVGQEIKRINPSCYDEIKQASDDLISKLRDRGNISNISTLFNTCTPIDSSEVKKSYFFTNILNPWAWNFQYAENSQVIQKQCADFQGYPGTSLEKLATHTKHFYQNSCISDLNDFINWYGQGKISGDYVRPWLYQCCGEYGWYQNANIDGPFPKFDNSFFIEICKRLFAINGNIHGNATKRTNTFYGSVKAKITKVITVHGSLDPWMKLGISESLDDESPVIIIQESSHCSDLGSVTISDSLALKSAKEHIIAYISKWIE